jgi:hypothetical protein
MKRQQATRSHDYREDWERPVMRSEVVLVFAAAGVGLVVAWFFLMWLFTL